MVAAVIREVGLRDGLQSIATTLATEQKCRWIACEADAGVNEFEATSMVPPHLLPQLADGPEVIRYAKASTDALVSVLVANVKGAERALALAVDKINYVMSASESHNQANVRRSTQASLDGFRQIVDLVEAHVGTAPILAAGVSTAFGCTIEGHIDEGRTADLAAMLVSAGADELIVADTVGYANPASVRRLLRQIANRLPRPVPLVGHFHDTRGLGLANCLAAMDEGVMTFDASLGGLGGCPHAPGATGNVATEDLVFMLEAMDVETGINLDRLLIARELLKEMLPVAPLSGSIVVAGLPKNFRAPL